MLVVGEGAEVVNIVFEGPNDAGRAVLEEKVDEVESLH